LLPRIINHEVINNKLDGVEVFVSLGSTLLDSGAFSLPVVDGFMVFVLGDAISWGTNLIQEVVKFQDLGVTEVHLSSFMVLLHIQADLGYVKLHVDEQSVGNEKFGIL